MAKYQTIIFNSSTDYQAAETLLLQMFSDLNAEYGCAKPEQAKGEMAKAMPFLQNLAYDKANNVQRWRNDIKSAYLLLQKLAVIVFVPVITSELIGLLPMTLSL